MATVRLLSDEEVRAIPEAWAVFEDIRATRKSDFVNNFWRALANDPPQLRRVWAAQTGHDGGRRAVAAGARADLHRRVHGQWLRLLHPFPYGGGQGQGMTDGQHAELLAVIGMAAQTNALVTSMQVPVDEAFLVK